MSDTVTVATVRYSITRSGLTPLEGNIGVGDPGAVTSAFIDVPVGTAYTIELATVSTDLTTTCIGEAMFDIVAGQVTPLTMTLQCSGGSGVGSVEVVAQFNSCPELATVAVAPLRVGLGGTIGVSASGADVDTGDTLTYAWTASGGGAFAASTQASTAFTCATVCRHTLTVTVSDGNCLGTRAVPIVCTP